MKRTFFIALALLCLSLGVSAHDFEVNGIYYVKNSDGTSVSVSYRGTSYSQYSGEYSGAVTIPPSVTYSGITYSVTSIGSFAFYDCKGLTSVTIPNSVTEIGKSAFSGCSGLTSVTIPDSVTSIGGTAFSGCSGLTSVTIPNSVTSIGGSAFINTPWYDNQSDGLVYAGKVAYKYKGTMPSDTFISIKEGTVSISPSCFFGCNGLTSVTIPNSVTSIGDSAFRYCNGLTSVTIPNSVTSIGLYVFRGCSVLTSIFVESGNKIYDSRDNCNAIVNTSNNELVVGCENTVIPNSVTSIDKYAFTDCIGLTEITIPNSVTSIGDSAFRDCIGLTKITIPNSVTSIGNSAFSGCSGSMSVTIGNSVTEIGNSAFDGCSGLLTVNWNAKNYPDFASADNAPFKGLTGINTFNFGNEVKKIPAYLCYGLSGLTSVTIGNSVTSIGSSAFYGCRGLTSVTIGNSVKTIDSSVFYNCSGLTSVTIPDSVITIGNAAFYYTGLTSIEIPNSVTSVGKYAFYKCYNLISVSIGSSVNTIGDEAFRYCNSLKDVTNWSDTPQTINSNVFQGVTLSAARLYVQTNKVATYSAANVWKDFGFIDGMTAPEDPVFSPAPGTYYKVVNISIVSPTEAAKIYITTNGEVPTEDSFLLTKELTLTESRTVKAVAVKNGLCSNVVTGVYVITDNPIIDPDQFVFTKVMETNDDMVASSNGRFSTGYDNAVYVTDKSAGTIYKYDASGNRSEFTSGLPSGIGSAITSDDAGNILIQNGWAGAGGAKNWIVIEPDETRYDLTINYDGSGVNAARLDASGRIVGNVLSQEGAYWCLLPGNGTNGAVIKLVNGEQVSITPVESGFTADYTAIAQPVFSGVSDYDEDPTSGWAFRKRGNGSITRDVARSYSDGFDIFKLGENTYTVEPIGTNYCDGYAIFQDGVAEPVAVKEETISSGSQRFQSLTARVSEDGTYATIYQNVSGYCASIYQFGMPPTGVDKVSTSDEASVVSTAYYNLQGVRVMNPAAGQILIKVNTLSNGQIRASKIEVK